jgi:hypothetical protein
VKSIGINIGFIDKFRLFGNVLSMGIKLGFAFVWHEELFEIQLVYLPEMMLLGGKFIPLINGIANMLNSYTYFEKSFQVRNVLRFQRGKFLIY